MTRAPAFLALATLLTACDQHQPAMTVEVLVHDPQRLQPLHHRCAVARPQVGEATCRIVDKAYAQRFFLGLGGADEYRTLSELPPIPPSFDGPDDGEGW
ncbi:hypothetical protein CS053_10775 [Rhodanobacter glycinis]|uniref:Lipoprotein n=1 Tax=Rhodanobacter glycinis TaxID=582702 RepID=A0A5B9E1S8_9GAMM|nr:hypothetical protein [Rhodanobacter glycinis]QEE24925.1 hypothetical protein CS053_10775 [Rhodanobacter glycinis]